MSKEPKRNVYVGHRYVPKIMGEWDKSESYEGLSIVTNKGTSYTSKKRVPKGIDILNEEYWVVTGNYNAQIEEYRKDIRNIEEEVSKKANSDVVTKDIRNIEEEVSKKANSDVVTTELEKKQLDLDGRGVNLRTLGAKLDGVTDDYDIVMDALDHYRHVIVPSDGVLATSKPIVISSGQSLVGSVLNVRNFYSSSPVIKYIGEPNARESLVIIGKNKVGAEPSLDASNVIFKNFHVDCQKKIGIGVYGTFITNETLIDNIVVRDSLEYNFYFARGWYATITNLTSLNCKGNGIALGMPLRYLDGTEITWSIDAPLQLNNVKIDNVRSMRAGEYFSEDNIGLFDARNNDHNVHGYGIGAGIGNGFRMENFLSEGSGGVNLYVYTGSQPSKSIRNGYLETSNRNGSITDPKEKCNMIIEHTVNFGGPYVIEDIFMNYASGGIYFKGEDRPVWIKNIFQPRFLRSLSGHTSHEIQQVVLKDKVFHECGYTNTRMDLGITIARETINTSNTWEIPVNGIDGGVILMYARLKSGNKASGGFNVITEDGKSVAMSFDTELTNEFTFLKTLNGTATVIRKNGQITDDDAEVEIKLVAVPPTYL